MVQLRSACLSTKKPLPVHAVQGLLTGLGLHPCGPQFALPLLSTCGEDARPGREKPFPSGESGRAQRGRMRSFCWRCAKVPFSLRVQAAARKFAFFFFQYKYTFFCAWAAGTSLRRGHRPLIRFRFAFPWRWFLFDPRGAGGYGVTPEACPHLIHRTLHSGPAGIVRSHLRQEG